MGRHWWQEVAVDRERVAELVGKKVAVGLDNGEPGSVGIVAKLEEVRDDGILLSEMSELGPGPTMFYPGDSLKQYSQWMPWLGMPRERRLLGESPQEYYELYEWREKPAGERSRGRPYLARTLRGRCRRVLRYRISYEKDMFEGGYGISGPEFVIRDESGRVLPWSPWGSGSSDTESDGEVEVRGLPESEELEVEVTRLVSLVLDKEAGREVEGDSYEGPWNFRFSV
jgi:hypothetical protein